MSKRKIPFYIISLIVVVSLAVSIKNVAESWQLQRELARAQSVAGVAAQQAGPQITPENSHTVEYRKFPFVGSRVAVWVIAELHLMFAAFVLAVPMFALIIELIGYYTKDRRYDHLAYEFTKLLSTSFSFTASLGALLTFMLIIYYPKLTTYLIAIFSPTFLPYVLLFFAKTGFLYAYYYG